MTEATNWRDVKAKARAADPDWDSPDRVSRRDQMREQMIAAVSGARLAQIRKDLGLTQVQLAEATGLSQARISQIENGDSMTIDVLRVYVTGLGGHVEVVARIGDIRLNVA
ncbi:helix-turn-helix domain-containing protein [Actinoplanes derwentensis]|uniref:Helix-turn-helix domain-containing protein n=1 Tax=Actinoplanes derwentensis TaxID=113562 RepID=A0A1H2CYZ4_9ACTN|nr:helix-turn-helix transcriptional regulator [Actinoplanes derwentensis]GID86581.1 putative antitoxin HigA3 [Actinoplanes derwentensis]SDT75735.1 Helix-turn-helix domain-containing protein [Actinoplanes derwentensis]